MIWTMAKLTGCAVAVLGTAVILGCADGPPADQLNSPPQGTAPTSSRLQENYIAMTDNEMLNDASMSSIHFVPRTAELNSLGVRRLTRISEILKVYGGTVYYDGTDPERDLRKDRVEKIRSFLASCGLDASRFNVEQGFAGGAGMSASESIAIREATRGPGDTKIGTQDGGASVEGGDSGGSGSGGAK